MPAPSGAPRDHRASWPIAALPTARKNLIDPDRRPEMVADVQRPSRPGGLR